MFSRPPPSFYCKTAWGAWKRLQEGGYRYSRPTVKNGLLVLLCRPLLPLVIETPFRTGWRQGLRLHALRLHTLYIYFIYFQMSIYIHSIQPRTGWYSQPVRSEKSNIHKSSHYLQFHTVIIQREQRAEPIYRVYRSPHTENTPTPTIPAEPITHHPSLLAAPPPPPPLPAATAPGPGTSESSPRAP